MLTRTLIERQARESNEHMARIHATFARYQKNPTVQNRQQREDAARAWHSSKTDAFYLWPLAARDQMRAGDRETIEDALLFLETDPWFFRSGYLKERVTRHLKSARLTETDRARLREAIFAVAIGRNRREWRDYCRLALQVLTPDWEDYLRAQSQTRAVVGGNKLNYLLRFFDDHRYKLGA